MTLYNNYTPQDIAETLTDAWGFAQDNQDMQLPALIDFLVIPEIRNGYFPILMQTGQVFLVHVEQLGFKMDADAFVRSGTDEDIWKRINWERIMRDKTPISSTSNPA